MFQDLVQHLTSEHILSPPRPGLPYSVDTDTSNYQVECALFQPCEEGERRPVGYFSRSLHNVERNYFTTKKECSAVVWSLQTLQPYLTGERYTVYIDYHSLHWLIIISEPSGRLIRWWLRLSEFDFDIQNKTVQANHQADALSRLTTRAETVTKGDDTKIPPLCLMHVSKSPEFLDFNYEDELFCLLIMRELTNTRHKMTRRIPTRSWSRNNITTASVLSSAFE